MSKKKYDKKADKILENLTKASVNLNDDDMIRVLGKAIHALNHSYASIK